MPTMGANKNEKLHHHRRKKKKKIKESKKLKSKIQNDSQMATRSLNPQNTSARIHDLIKETMINISREKIVQLLMQVRNKAENCYDFEVSWWLHKYLEQTGEVNLIEAAYVIVNAGHIYERKVDYFYELIRRSVQSDEDNAGTGDKKVQAPKPRRKITRQAVSLHDRLYESEMIVKQFKQVPAERTTEILTTSSFKAPSNYFKKWSEYKVWRQNHKKKMKSPVPYSTVCDDLYLHVAMWGLSCIEDFEYDDDLDTKRNYRIFTHHMEHRYNTLVPDINFIMHFKVKDFIEAEEDDIEIKRILDLPAPPTRQWPPFCKAFRRNEYATDVSNIDVGESAEDYTKKYVDLEDIVLEKQCYEIDRDLFRSATEAQKKSRGGVLSQELPSKLGVVTATAMTVETTQIESDDNVFVDAMEQEDDSPMNSVEISVQAQTSLKDIGAPLANSTTVSAAESILHESRLSEEDTAKSSPADSAIVEQSQPAAVTENFEASTQSAICSTQCGDDSQALEKSNSLTQLTVDSTETGYDTQSGSQLVGESTSNTEETACTAAVERNITSAEIEPNIAVPDLSGSQLVGESTSNTEEAVNTAAVSAAEENKTSAEIEPNTAVVNQLAANLMKALNENSPVKIGNRSPSPNTGKQDSLQLSPCRRAIIDSIEILPTLNPHPPEVIPFSDSQPPKHVDDPAQCLGEPMPEIGMKDPAQIISDNIKSNIKDQIVIRISIDEGVAFSDLDDVDKAMLSPVVELVDIFNPIKEDLGNDLRNIFEIDERYLSLEETFKLPLDMVCKKPEIEYNILKLPECRLKRKIHFALPAEFQLYMNDRMKRRCVDKNDHVPTKMIKMFKLNEQDIKNIPQTPPVTPVPEDDFLGFDEADQTIDNITWNDVLSSTLNPSESKVTPNRTISRDSGIGLSSLAAIDGPDEVLSIDQVANGLEASILGGIIESENPNVPCSVESSESPNLNNSPVSGVEMVNSVDKTTTIATLEKSPDEGDHDEMDSVFHETSTQKTKDPILSKRTYLESSAEFEQNLYEKCSNGVAQTKDSDNNLIRDRVQQWHRYLRPILAMSRERHHFDIYRIGTNIMDTFPPSSPNERPPVITLKSVMQEQDPTFLSRYFLSMLQLANANNIEIKVENRSTDKPTLLSDVHLKLISRKRHSVSIEDDIGATAKSSRKRQHSISDDSDSDSECRIPSPINVPSGFSHRPIVSSSHRKQPITGNAKSPVQPIPSGNDSQSGVSINSSHQLARMGDCMSSSKTSTPCNTVSKSLHRQQQQMTTTSSARAFNISSMSTFSPIPSSSKAPSVLTTISNSENFNVSNISSVVSNNSLVSAYTNSELGNIEQTSSNHLSTPSISQENPFKNHPLSLVTESNASSALRNELLPPFDSIRRHGDITATNNLIESITYPSGNSGNSCSKSGQMSPSYQASSMFSSPPKLIRTQEAMSLAKRSRFGHDDLDSGIFSEFSVNESGSMIS